MHCLGSNSRRLEIVHYLGSNGRRLEQSGRPGPLGDDSRGGEAHRYVPASIEVNVDILLQIANAIFLNSRPDQAFETTMNLT